MARERIKSVQGTQDVLPGEWGGWRRLSEAARRVCRRYGYGEVRTPIFEQTRLFVKGTGQTTEIVEKQMYTIPTGDGEGLTLRPEGTPPVIRAYLERNLHKREPFQKLYYMGPMFRRERPQRGRLREFHQFGVEALGSASPLMDAETICLAVDVLREVGLKEFRLSINTMGCGRCRPAYRDELFRLLSERADALCPEHRERFGRNVFRVLDCKKEACRRATADLPPIGEYLCDGCALHYEQVKAALAAAGVAFEEDAHLVRGLDYYTRTVYELKHASLGARDTVCGGGRYDELVEMLGGPHTPCVGFAMGMEAVLLAMEAELGPAPEEAVGPSAYVVCFEEDARQACFELTQQLRRQGVAADTDFESRSPKAQMRVAHRLGAAFCILVGRRELDSGQLTVRSMAEGTQWTVAWDELPAEVARKMADLPSARQPGNA